MKFHTLAGLITATLLFSACNSDGTLSDTTADSSNANSDPAPAAAFSDDSTFAYMLVTGYSSTDTVAYWNCSVQGADSSVENLHMRFWEDGSGFSGPDATTWQPVGENGIDIDFAGGSFNFRDVTFSSSDHEDDLLSASNGTFDNVLCQRKGPLRGQSMNTAFSDAGLGLLESHLLNQPATSWTCQEQDRQDSVFVTNYEFLANSIATLDAEAGRWFVDDRYNVVLSINGEVLAIRDIQFQNPQAGRTHFLAQLYDRALDCRLT